jgi:hypothetical protein
VAKPSSPFLIARSALLGLLTCGLVCLSACPRDLQGGSTSNGSGTGGSGAASDSDEDSGQRLDQLSRSDLQDFCQDLNEELSTRFGNRRLASYACIRQYIQSGDTLTCNQGSNECLRTSTQLSIGAPRPADFQIDNDECAGIGACPLSVAVFDACIGDRFDQSEQLITRVSCGLANDPVAVDALLRQIDAPRPLPQSCAAVASTCPGLL